MAVTLIVGVGMLAVAAGSAIVGGIQKGKANKIAQNAAAAQLEVEKKAIATQSSTALAVAQSHDLANILTSSDETMTALNIAALSKAFDSQTQVNVAAIQAQAAKSAQGANSSANTLFLIAGTAGAIGLGFMLARKKT